MLAQNSFRQTKAKLNRFLDMLEERMFETVSNVQMDIFQTKEHYYDVPDDALFTPPVSNTWGGESMYGWFKGDFVVPKELEGKALFAIPKTDFYEALLYVNNEPHSNYAKKIAIGPHGNHYANRFVKSAKTGDVYHLALECYAHHEVMGTGPMTYENTESFVYEIAPFEIAVRDDKMMEFLYDMRVLVDLSETPSTSFSHKAQLENALFEIHLCLDYDIDHLTKEELHQTLDRANVFVKKELQKTNMDEDAPFVGLIGHSHMDTAWLWPILETKKKCARTYANQLNLMEEYDNYKFVQSSAYHSDIIRRHYPTLFQRIQQAVKEGKYEPNGGVFVECDCNLTGGEYMVRQFLWGQRFTQKYFNYTADCFWLPDTFGYAYSIPQIMKGCKVDYFLTTKLSWCDTTVFPYTSFYWQGVDGTKVFTHLNRTHHAPIPSHFYDITQGDDKIKQPRVSKMRLLSYGRGDGGGGPEFGEIEMANRLHNLEDVPRSKYLTVSEFMHEAEKTAYRPDTYAGELYLELHRGTLTNQHDIKRNNRKAEIALHDLEVATTVKAVEQKIKADSAMITPLMQDVLVRQFHDILPGTCVHSAHVECKKVITKVLQDAHKMTQDLLCVKEIENALTLYNTLSFDRQDTLHIATDFDAVKGYESQKYEDVLGDNRLAIWGVQMQGMSSTVLEKEQGKASFTPHAVKDLTVETPYFIATLDEKGGISSLVDKKKQRELVKGLPFNTFLMAKDVPASYDNWDIDADAMDTFAPCAELIKREVVSDGAVELRIRSFYNISDKSTICQDMVFDYHKPMISFDTIVDFNEEHRFLKTAFDTSLHADGVKNEIQFGYIRRSNHPSTDAEKARFEVCNHKYSDMSENSYGICLINDCKYGISFHEGSMRLSLHKGGMRPDPYGDKGKHEMHYAIVLHDTAFDVPNVVQPAYMFNYAPLEIKGQNAVPSLFSLNNTSVIAEAVKPCEDAQNAYIIRLYEAGGDYANAHINFAHKVQKMFECNMLEEELCEVQEDLAFKPFEIKTIKVYYEGN